MKYVVLVFTSILAFFTIGISAAFAHVIVHPSEVGVAARQEFSISVPTEKDTPTVGLKLLIPKGLKDVAPNVKAGWAIQVVKNGTGDDASVTEIDWTGGSIPPGQRDDFLFQAQVPPEATTLQWKAYQAYGDGSVISWDHAPTKNPDDDAAPPPYSTTKVVNDLTDTTSGAPAMKDETDTMSIFETLAIVSLIFSGAALYFSWKKR